MDRGGPRREQLLERDRPHARAEAAQLADDGNRAELRQPRERRLDGVEQLVLDDEHLGAGGLHEVLEERAAVVDVHGHLHGPERRRAEPRDRELHPVTQHDENAVARPGSERGEPAGDGARGGRHLAERQLAIAQREREVRLVGKLLAGAGEQPRQRPLRPVRDDEAHRSVSATSASSE